MAFVERVLLVVGLLISLGDWSAKASLPSDSHYIAGVVEFQPASSSLDSLERLNNNLNDYLAIITSQQATDVDIIIFPEGTLNNYEQLTYVPDPKDQVIPCTTQGYHAFLTAISCQAIDSKKYIVINLTEKEDCTEESQAASQDPRPCAEDGLSYFNTNVVFDRNGVVISRYRKWNLYNEPWNVTHTPEHGQFETDFGVTFGHFICFDILFYTPASEMVKSGITDFIFPTMWFSQLPFLTGVQIQQSWAYSYDVNLLTAGASNPSIGNTGSGIFAGVQGPLISVMNSSPVRKLYVASVPKRQFARENPVPVLQLQIRNKRATTSTLNGLFVKRDYRIDEYTTELVDPSKLTTRLCHESFCCDFAIKTTTLSSEPLSSSYKYRYAAYSGLRPYTNMEPIYTRICTIFSCKDETLETCALAFEEDVIVSPTMTFDSITIEADFTKSEELLLMPNSVDEYLMPLTVDSFEFNITDKGGVKSVRYQLLKSRDNLMNFGIYGNYFHGYSAASSLLASRLLAVATIMLGAVWNVMKL